MQEKALNKLFLDELPNNNNLTDILIKAATLNAFYSTNIFSIYPMAKNIYELKIDKRLISGDIKLVEDIQKIKIKDKEKNFYSFATKYCSHHNPIDFPIYDSYVSKILCYFRDYDNFSTFKNKDLKEYDVFKLQIIKFRSFYDLENYNLKEIDKYLWQLGKQHFSKFN